MPWQRLILDSERDLAPTLDEWLAEHGAMSVSLEDSGDEPLFDIAETEKPLWSRTTVVALFADDEDLGGLMDQLAQYLAPRPLPAWRQEELADREWERVWLDRFHPIHIHGPLWISPHGMTPPDPNAVTVYIDPGLAFGTGTHPTTHLCLQWLAEQDLTGRVVLDYGCGSGILAIAALKLGAHVAWGVDNDADALRVAMENARANGVAEAFTVFLPDELPTGHVADVTVANILAQPLMDLAPELERHTAGNGRIALSGILEPQADMVRKCYDAAFKLEVIVRENWALLSGSRRENAIDP
jgi:ribosomal protein L11 methyltransferase